MTDFATAISGRIDLNFPDALVFFCFNYNLITIKINSLYENYKSVNFLK